MAFSPSPLDENKCLLVTAGDGKTRVYPWIPSEKTFSRMPIVLDTGERRTDRAITGTFNKTGTKFAVGSTDGNVYIFAVTPTHPALGFTQLATPKPPTISASLGEAFSEEQTLPMPIPTLHDTFPTPTLLARLPGYALDPNDKKKKKKDMGVKEVKFSRCGDRVLTGCVDGTAMVHWFEREKIDGKGDWRSKRLIIDEPTQLRASGTVPISAARRNLMSVGAGADDVDESAGEGDAGGSGANHSLDAPAPALMASESSQGVGTASQAEDGPGPAGLVAGAPPPTEAHNVLTTGQPAPFNNGQAAPTGQQAMQEQEELKVGVTQLGWSLDDSLIFAIMLDGLIRIWDSQTLELIHTLPGHTSIEVYTSDVHPTDPRILMTAGYDGKMIMWDIISGKELKRFEFGEVLLSGCFSPDGSQIALVDYQGRAHVCGLPNEKPSPYDRSPYDQFFDLDWSIVRQDQNGALIDEQAQIAPELVELGDVVNGGRSPYPGYAKIRSSLPVDGLGVYTKWSQKIREGLVQRIMEEMGILEIETKNANPNPVIEDKPKPKKRRRSESDQEPDMQFLQEIIFPLPESSGDEYAGNGASEEDDNDSDIGDMEVGSDDPSFVVDDDAEETVHRKARRSLAEKKKRKKQRRKKRAGGSGSGKRKRQLSESEEEDADWDPDVGGSSSGRRKRTRVVSYKDELEDDLDDDVEIKRERRVRRDSRTDDSEPMQTETESEIEINMTPSPSPPPRSKKAKHAAGPSGSNGQTGSGSRAGKNWFRAIGIGSPSRSQPGDWITQVEAKRTPYLPQIGDFVAYIKKGHEKFVEVAQQEYPHLRIPTTGPGGLDPKLPGVVYGEVRKLTFLATNPEVACVEIEVWVEHGGEFTWKTDQGAYAQSWSQDLPPRPYKARMHPLKINDKKETLRVAYADVDQCEDFLVLFDEFVASVFDQELAEGVMIMAGYQDGEYEGTVENVGNGFREGGWDGCWESVSLTWHDGSGGANMSPWEIRTDDETWAWTKRQGLSDDERTRISAILANYIVDTRLEVFVEPVDYASYPTYLQGVAYPVCLEMMQERLKNGFYRSVQAVAWDVDTMAANAKIFNEEGSDIWNIADTLLPTLRNEILGPKPTHKRGPGRGRQISTEDETPQPSSFKVKLKFMAGGGTPEADGGGTAGSVEEYSEAGGESEDEDRWEGRAQRKGKGRRVVISDEEDDDGGNPSVEMYENGALLKFTNGRLAQVPEEEVDPPWNGGMSVDGQSVPPETFLEGDDEDGEGSEWDGDEDVGGGECASSNGFVSTSDVDEEASGGVGTRSSRRRKVDTASDSSTGDWTGIGRKPKKKGRRQ
ncbi:hypothetical protein HDV00_006493 [Rhizophlyctis rosea]|nr:hypothetical protein HDV00_006493 [Rhizophlyctis rosea]